MRRVSVTVFAVGFALALGACDPKHPCDPGYYADHGACYTKNTAHDAAVSGDASSDAAASEGPAKDKYAGFGRGCEKASDCPETAPSCLAPQLPICTVLNCLGKGSDICPPNWKCMDVKGISPDPSVESVCLNL